MDELKDETKVRLKKCLLRLSKIIGVNESDLYYLAIKKPIRFVVYGFIELIDLLDNVDGIEDRTIVLIEEIEKIVYYG
jgi:hypothetical protein